MNQIKNAITSAVGRKTILLFAGQLLLMVVGFGIKKIQTHVLGVEDYGIYALVSAIVLFGAIIFRFGFFESIQVLLTQAQSKKEESRLIGVGLFISTAIGVLFGLSLYGLSFIIDRFYDFTMSSWLVLIAPLTVIVPFRYFVHAVAVGTHRVNLITVYDNLAKVLFAILLLVFWYTNIADLTLVLVANFITLILALFYILSRIPIRLDGFNATLLQVWGKTKSFGFHYFIGSASNQATYKLDEIIISYFISAAQTGLYSLAVVITSPLVLASQSLSQVLFKRFSTADKISKNTFLYNFIWLVAGYGGIILFVDQVVDFLFGAEFSQVTQYAYGIGIACIFQGLYQPFEFLSAKSEGKKIRNISIVEAVINVVGNIILIPIYGVWGAIYTSIVAKMIHLAGKYYYYRQYISGK